MKKRNGRKIIACALAFVLMIGVLPTQAFAATDSELKEIPSVVISMILAMAIPLLA